MRCRDRCLCHNVATHLVAPGYNRLQARRMQHREPVSHDMRQQNVHAFSETPLCTSTQADASAMPAWPQRQCQVLANGAQKRAQAGSTSPPWVVAPSAEPHNQLPQRRPRRASILPQRRQPALTPARAGPARALCRITLGDHCSAQAACPQACAARAQRPCWCQLTL